jgi:hypothetical protein
METDIEDLGYIAPNPLPTPWIETLESEFPSMAVRDELAADHQWDSPGKGRFARLRAGESWIRTVGSY